LERDLEGLNRSIKSDGKENFKARIRRNN
ncbi:MAG: hypothetical protein ACI9W7_000706, partial [Porticoccaceae bacterium]